LKNPLGITINSGQGTGRMTENPYGSYGTRKTGMKKAPYKYHKGYGKERRKKAHVQYMQLS